MNTRFKSPEYDFYIDKKEGTLTIRQRVKGKWSAPQVRFINEDINMSEAYLLGKHELSIREEAIINEPI